MMKNDFRKKLKVLLLVLLFPFWLSAQHTVTGVVSDKNGELLIGVSVVEKNKDTYNGVVTDFNGRYTINVSTSSTIEFSYIGYLKQSVAVNGKIKIDVSMQEDSEVLDEIVVVGYGTQRRQDVTGSISSITGTSIQALASSNLSQSLQGRMAGVEMTPNSSRPGSEMQIRIRGTRSLTAGNDPLVVLDGIPFAGSFSDINPGDIKSVDVLKDASATAIYGSRGANGVIIVTTNRGAITEGKAVVKYNAYYGVRSILNKYPMMNAEEFIEWRAEAARNGRIFPNGADEDNSYNTDWQGLLFQKGIVNSHDLSMSKATDGGSFTFGTGYYKETTVLPGQEFSRISLRGTFDQEIGDRVRVGITTQNSYSVTGGGNDNPLYGVLQLPPIARAYDDNGELIKQIQLSQDPVFNPLMIKDLGDKWVDERETFATYNTLYAEVKLLEGLRYRINVGLNYRQSTYGNYKAPQTPYNNSLTESNARIENTHLKNWAVENLLYYDKTFAKKHRLGLTALFSAEQTQSKTSNIYATNITADFLQYYNLGYNSGNITIDPNRQRYFERGLVSYMFRATYGYDDRYLLTATVRSDGSSVLAKGHKWHTYPALSVGWNMKNEAFMQNVDVLNSLKLRVGFGETSNQAINPYQTLGSLSSYYYNFGDTNTSGYFVGSLPNPGLGWEYSTTWNYGADFSLLGGRLNGTIEYYTQSTKDVLMSQRLPTTSGVSSFMTNVGSTSNKGVELSLSADILTAEKNGGWDWNVGFNLYSNKNKITSLSSGQMYDKGNGWFVGQPIDVIYDYKKLGIWQLGEEDIVKQYEGSTGDVGMIKVEYRGEYNADGTPVRQIGTGATLDDDDRQILGTIEPDFQGGFNTRIGYKNFDLSIIGNYRKGGILVSSIYSSTGYLNLNNGRRGQVKIDYWTPENPTNAYPKPGGLELNNNPKYASTLAYFDGTYLKINAITLGYNFEQEWLKKLSASQLRLYCTVQNPFIFASDYYKQSGLDPQPNSGGRSNQATPENSVVPERINVVGYNTPSTRNYMIGVNVTF